MNLRLNDPFFLVFIVCSKIKYEFNTGKYEQCQGVRLKVTLAWHSISEHSQK